MPRIARHSAAPDPGARTLRGMAATVERLLRELRQVTEDDLQARGAGPVERARVADELEALYLEQEALLRRLVRLEALATGESVAQADAGSAAPGPAPEVSG